MKSGYQIEMEGRSRWKLALTILGFAISLGAYLLFASGAVPMSKGDMLPFIVTGLFLLVYCTLRFLNPEYEWEPKLMAISGSLYIVLTVLIVIRDLNLPMPQ